MSKLYSLLLYQIYWIYVDGGLAITDRKSAQKCPRGSIISVWQGDIVMWAALQLLRVPPPSIIFVHKLHFCSCGVNIDWQGEEEADWSGRDQLVILVKTFSPLLVLKVGWRQLNCSGCLKLSSKTTTTNTPFLLMLTLMTNDGIFTNSFFPLY